jgi:hypothetical protein
MSIRYVLPRFVTLLVSSYHFLPLLTVMSTVGYGNQSPSTQGGRLMIYLVGFDTILAFAGTLAMSGYIVSELWENAV